MSCKLKHKDSKSNTKEVMMSNGAIDNFYKITNLGIFRSFNTKLSDLATSKYGVTGRLYLEDNDRAIPNTPLFNQIDKERKRLGLYDNQERANVISKSVFQFKEGKAKDLVIEIANSGGTFAPLANKLKERIGDVKVKSVQVGSDKYKELTKVTGLNDFQGLYVPSDDIIYMVEGIEYNQEQILLHEVLHHLTAFEIRRPGNKEKIESIYQKVLMELEKNNISTSIYALKNIDEFVVGLFTDPKLVKILTDLPGESTSIWKDIVDFLKSMIGVEKQDTLFDEVIKDVVTMIGDRSTEYFTFEGLEDLSMASVQYSIDSNSTEDMIASEKTIRDLASRMSERIGINYYVISDRTQKFKGVLKGDEAIINLAYATLDTPIHEILGHPIINQIKNRRSFISTEEKVEFDPNKPFRFGKIKLEESGSKLYENLLKELEYGIGKEVLNRIKQDYIYKDLRKPDEYIADSGAGEKMYFHGKESLEVFLMRNPEYSDATIYPQLEAYTLEEQQEEAIVELLGLMTADRLNNVKDGKLISLLKRLLKEIKFFVRNLLRQKEVNIDDLPDNMTLGDIADLLAYSNNKLVLKGYEVEYKTPDDKRFKTYQEASAYVSKLGEGIKDPVITRPVSQIKDIKRDYWFDNSSSTYTHRMFIKRNNGTWYASGHVYTKYTKEQIEEIKKDESGDNAVDLLVINSYNRLFSDNFSNHFLRRNNQYEISKLVVEKWKKENNIIYNPEEIYSRGQEFVSVLGAYSEFEVDLLLKNLLQHIEDNRNAGGEFLISAFTRPVDRVLGHLEAGGGKIRFKIYPKPKDIKWATNVDAYSGSVWESASYINEKKKSELLGVSYTKYPSLEYLSNVQPNLSSIIDKLAHHHNEVGISLDGSNFRMEYDSDIPNSTKKVLNGINLILEQKYGKIEKPKISSNTPIQPIENNTLTDIEIIKDQVIASNFSLKEDPIQKEEYEEYPEEEWTEDGITFYKDLNDTVRVGRREGNYFMEVRTHKILDDQLIVSLKVDKFKSITRKVPRIFITGKVIKSGFSSDSIIDDENLPFQRIPGTKVVSSPGLPTLTLTQEQVEMTC